MSKPYYDDYDDDYYYYDITIKDGSYAVNPRFGL